MLKSAIYRKPHWIREKFPHMTNPKLLPFVYNLAKPPSQRTLLEGDREARQTYIICEDMSSGCKFLELLEMGRKDKTGEEQA